MGDNSVQEISKVLFDDSEPVQLFKADDHLTHEEQCNNDQIADIKVDSLEQEIIKVGINMPSTSTQTNESTEINKDPKAQKNISKMPEKSNRTLRSMVRKETPKNTIVQPSGKNRTTRKPRGTTRRPRRRPCGRPRKIVVEEVITEPQFIEEMFYKDVIDDPNIQLYLPNMNDNETITVILEMADDSLHNQNEIIESQLPLQIVDADMDYETYSEGNILQLEKMIDEVISNIPKPPKCENNDQLQKVELSILDKDNEKDIKHTMQDKMEMKEKISGAIFSSEISDTSEYLNAEKIDEADLDFQMREIINENFDEWQLPGVETEYMDAIELELQDIISEQLDKQLNSTDIISETGQPQLSNEYEDEYVDHDNSQYLIAEEEMNQDLRILSDSTGENQDNIILIERQMREIMGDNLEQYVNYGHGVEIDAIEFELQQLMNERLDILQNQNVIMNDAEETVRKPQPIVNSEDKTQETKAYEYDQQNLADMNEIDYEQIDEIEQRLQDIMGENLQDQYHQNLLDTSEFDLLQCLEEGKVDTIESDSDDLLLSNTKDYQIVNSEDKIQETKPYEYDQQNLADKNEPDYEQVIQVDEIEQQLRILMGENLQDQPHQNVLENSEFELLECLQDDKVDNIETHSDCPVDPGVPEDPDYVHTNEEAEFDSDVESEPDFLGFETVSGQERKTLNEE